MSELMSTKTSHLTTECRGHKRRGQTKRLCGAMQGALAQATADNVEKRQLLISLFDTRRKVNEVHKRLRGGKKIV